MGIHTHLIINHSNNKQKAKKKKAFLIAIFVGITNKLVRVMFPPSRLIGNILFEKTFPINVCLHPKSKRHLLLT